MSETIIETLDRLDAVAEKIKSLTERASDLEDQFKEYQEKATEVLKNLSWADSLPDRLGKIEEVADPIKEWTDELTEKLLESAKNEKSILESLDNQVQELEKILGVKS
jgi:uncharacterized coiled-coil DUF342 family protein